MLSNSEIADLFSLTAKLLELQNGDDRRIKTYANAAYIIERLEPPIYEMTEKQMLEIQGIGKMLAKNIFQILQSNSFDELDELMVEIPAGVIEMFKVKGLGVKKIKLLWNELGIDSIESLKLACLNNQIATIKGFGAKTQESILLSIAFIEDQKGKLRMNKAHLLAEQIKEILEEEFKEVRFTGQIKRNDEVVNKLSFIVPSQNKLVIQNPLFVKNWKLSNPFRWVGNFDENETLIEIIFTENTINDEFLYSASEAHLLEKNAENKTLYSLIKNQNFDSEEAIYTQFGSNFIVPEMRNGENEFEWSKNHSPDELVTWNDIKGTVHNHSTYSDGKHSLVQMAEKCIELGLEYFGIADHSQTATYAQGLSPDRVWQQHLEIDKLNAQFSGFKILKGIESDILIDGSLDYEPEILASFDYVVASVHQSLSMDIVKATDRILKAIQNPYTTILGHPTGRLLLAREGYPIDYKTIIDACAAFGVIMELNASPYRLDLDWRWFDYCMEKGVKISINPDAHEMNGLLDMHYGVKVARKGGLTQSMTFNALSLEEMTTFLKKRKQKA